MNQPLSSGGRYGSTVSNASVRNNVMRNTYWLLALSMLPTVLGAWIGVATGITAGLTGGILCSPVLSSIAPPPSWRLLTRCPPRGNFPVGGILEGAQSYWPRDVLSELTNRLNWVRTSSAISTKRQPTDT